MPVRKPISLAGPSLVFLTISVRNRVPVFDDPLAATNLLQTLREVTAHFEIETIAYVVMPDHIHGLFGCPQYSVLPKCVQSLKSLSARRLLSGLRHSYQKALMTPGGFRMWKRRYDDLVITTRAQFEVKLNYIHRNPVRAGIVDDAEDYPYSSAGHWLAGSCSQVPLSLEALKYVPS